MTRSSYDSVPWNNTMPYSNGPPTYINDNDVFSAKYLTRLEKEKADYFKDSKDLELRNPQAKYWDDPDNIYSKSLYKYNCGVISYIPFIIFMIFIITIVFIK